MRKFFASAVIASLLVPGVVKAEEVSTQPAGPGVPSFVKVLLFPLYVGARVQASLDPEKPSCWNDGSTEVAGCRVAEKYDAVLESRDR